MPDESLERPPVAPIVAVVVAGVVGVIVLKWVVGTIFAGVRFVLLVAVIAAVVYGVSKVRSSSDE